MRDMILTVFVFGILPFIIASPHIGIYAWAWMSYMNPHRLTYGFAYNFPFAAIIAATTIISIVLSKEPKRIPWSPMIVFLIVFIIWMNVTTLYATSPDSAYHQWEKVMKIQVGNFLMLMMIRGRDRIHGLVWVIAVSIGFFGIKGGIFTILTAGSYRVWGPEGSFFYDNNAMALALLMVLPLMWYLWRYSCDKRIKALIVISMFLCSISVLGSYSRGAFLAGITVALIAWWRSKKKAQLMLIALLVVPIIASQVPDKWFGRMQTIETYEEDSSAMGRVNAWRFAYNLAKANFFGGGFETFQPDQFLIYAPNPNDVHDAHSIYFEVLGEHGFIGLALFLVIGILGWRTGSKIISLCNTVDENRWASDLAIAIRMSLVAYAVGGAFLGLAYFDLYYNLLSLLVVTLLAITPHEEATGIRYKLRSVLNMKAE